MSDGVSLVVLDKLAWPVGLPPPSSYHALSSYRPPVVKEPCAFFQVLGPLVTGCCTADRRLPECGGTLPSGPRVAFLCGGGARFLLASWCHTLTT